ncbi:MAG: M48 family metallopeptidase [Clostridia bacterium]|nr:M48 family metallopeptidase [Clostridia bacterium]
MAYDYLSYVHDSDRAALKALKAIPGFSTLLKGFMSVWNEPQAKILNMSSRVRLGPKQLSEYYDMLPPICEKLGIDVPELYLELNPVPNAYTSGDNRPFIVVTSGLLKALPAYLVPTVLAHECGHIACHHVLYSTMGRVILGGAMGALSGFRLAGLISAPLQMAFYHWMRSSEYSADRAAVLVDGAPEKMQEVCFRLAGYDKDIQGVSSMDAFIEQAAQYREMIRESTWNKSLEFMILKSASHPLTAVRALECREWAASDRFIKILAGLPVDRAE